MNQRPVHIRNNDCFVVVLCLFELLGIHALCSPFHVLIAPADCIDPLTTGFYSEMLHTSNVTALWIVSDLFHICYNTVLFLSGAMLYYINHLLPKVLNTLILSKCIPVLELEFPLFFIGTTLYICMSALFFG